MRADLDTSFFDPPRPRTIAHRGFSGRYPENTLAAFRAARDIGACYVELDTHLTRDGEPVVSHDPDLTRSCGIEIVIGETPLSSLAGANPGFNFTLDGLTYPFRSSALAIPSLAEVFAELPDLLYVVEVKEDSAEAAQAVIETARRSGMIQRILIASEHRRPVEAARRLAPGVPTNLPTREVGEFMASLAPGAESYIALGDAIQIPPEHMGWRMATRESVAMAHRLGLEMHVWTVNEASEMRELLALGVDGILTDYPDRLLALV